MNLNELEQSMSTPQVGDRIELEFGDSLVIETSIIGVNANSLLIYTDKLTDNLLVDLSEAKYQGKSVKLNKPIRTGTNEPGKFKVYVKDPKTGNIKMVRFGHQGGGKNKDSKTMRIKKSNPARRKSFRARHNCDNPGPKTKARYWSCRAW